MSLASLIRNRALTAADTWERHLVVAQLAGEPQQVVDVGGLPGQLRSFLPGASTQAGLLVIVAWVGLDAGDDDAAVFLRAAILLAVGAALWLVNRLVDGPPEEGLDAERLQAG